MYINVHAFMNMYILVCTMFRHVNTVLQYPVQVGRIPDVKFAKLSEAPMPTLGSQPGHGLRLSLSTCRLAGPAPVTGRLRTPSYTGISND
jgi:hypothetical protein